MAPAQKFSAATGKQKNKNPPKDHERGRAGVDWNQVDPRPTGDALKIHEDVLRRHVASCNNQTVRDAQKEDLFCSTILYHIKEIPSIITTKLGEGLTPAALRRIKRDLPFYRVTDGLLYRIEPKVPGPTRWRLVVPTALQECISTLSTIRWAIRDGTAWLNSCAASSSGKA